MGDMAARRTLKIYFHDACFDGTASAALFARFYRDVIGPAEVATVGMHHTDGDPFAGIAIDGDDNACVDFRFCADPAMRWWFDHHRTAFQPHALRDVFDGDTSGTKFFDPRAPSCAGFIARTCAERWGWSPPPNLAELVRWADVIDAARFASATEATALDAPAQKLALWLGAAAGPAEIARYIAALGDTALAELARAPWIQPGLDAAIAARGHQRELVERRGEWRGDVVSLDLADEAEAITPGFLGYELYPACRYTVAITRSPSAVKIAVGWNPWGPPRRHDVGALCERFGGGGHAAVGGVTLGPDQLGRGRAALASIVATLAEGGEPA
jgi:hypothetical protein